MTATMKRCDAKPAVSIDVDISVWILLREIYVICTYLPSANSNSFGIRYILKPGSSRYEQTVRLYLMSRMIVAAAVELQVK